MTLNFIKANMDSLNANYWNTRYHEKRMGWDIGYPSTPLKTYIDQIENKQITILIPGGGNSYEAEYLFQLGFKNVYVVDVAEKTKQNFLERIPTFPKTQFLVSDFFEVTMTFDLILEQTFFCALHPSLRQDYTKKMHQLLKPSGKLIGVLFDFPLVDGPPFGGSKEEYEGYFKPYFRITILERCYNSIPPRQGKELFFILQHKPKV